MAGVGGNRREPNVGLRVRELTGNQSGVTGLETAIILIAFTVVASVFAFTILSTGMFSAARGKETVYAGLNEASSSLRKTSGMVGYGVLEDIISNGDLPWTIAVSSSVSSTTGLMEKKQGTASALLTVQTAFTTGLIAYEDTATPVDLSDQTQLKLWVRSTTTTAPNQMEIVLDEDAACASPEAQIHLPALAANTWTLVTAAITLPDGVTPVANPDKDAILCVGLDIKTDLSTSGDVTIHLDELVGAGEITQLVFNVINTNTGEPVDLEPASDADGDGVADPDGEHTLVISYYDRNQLVRDLYWSVDFLGADDGDSLLEDGERAEITILLAALDDATPLTTNESFSIEIKPAQGNVLDLRRKTPRAIDRVMTLD